MPSEEYLARQKDGIWQVLLHEKTNERVAQYAADNEMSFSEAIAEIKKAYVDGTFPPGRKRRTRRVSVWIRPEDKETHLAFVKKVRADKSLSMDTVIESALGELGLQ